MAVNRVKGDKPQKGQAIVNYEEKVFPDYKANPGERALFLVHTVPYEGSVAGINMLTAIRAQRKGYDVSVVFYGPASGIPVYRGWAKIWDDGYGVGVSAYSNIFQKKL